ncbi:MAG: S8 family serine peptidase, partial [Pirellulaceae bacterium]|nr:S8 family serine peptidase [Pirellulaceae bacterium]
SWGWSGFPFDAVSDAIAAHEQAGILFVTAAGNASSDNDYTPAYPASYPLDNIISVASTDNQDNRSWFSNYGAASVDLGAPGSAVLSTTPSFVYPYTGYSYFWGTSMATPQVTGVAALAWSLAPDATYQQVKDAILNGVDPIPALDGITVSGGRLNAYNTLQQLGISVVSTAPAVDSIVSSPPTQFTVNFSLPVDPASVQAVDLAVNGIPADAVLMEDSDTLTFTFAGTSPVTSEGIQTMAMAPGAIAVDPSAGAQVPFRGFAGTFRYDALQLQVVATNPPTSGGKFVLPGPFSYDVHFNEPVDPNSISTSDLLLTGLDGAAVHGATVAPDGTTATFVIEGIGGEGTLVAQIAAGAITDVYGNPGAAFSASYVVDYGTAPYPVPLTPVAPLGSLIYDPVQYGFIDPAGDTDSFTVAVDPGQTITVLMESSATLRSTVRISGPGNAVLASTTAAAPGADALLQAVRVPGQLAGNGPGPTMYTVTVGGANGTTGQYALRIILNAALETELHNGLSNDTRGSAQNLDSSFIALHSAGANGNSPQPQRGAVLGQITVDAPVVPNADETIGLGRESGNAFPFALDAFGIPSMRYQQIYAALQFPNGGVIDEIRFRRFSGSEPFTDLQLDVQIRLSYAATSVTTASTAFAQNVGENVTTVYDGLLVLSSTDDGTNMPLSFDVVIDVDDAFVYDPARGDLLVDFFVRDSNYAAVTYFAATDDPAVDAATTRIFSSYSVDDEYGTRGLYGGGPYGLVTQIVFDTPPDSGDWYRFDLKSGQSASVALSVLQGHDAQVALVSASGATLAISSPNQATNVDQIISNYVATSTGTYFLKVTSQAGATYSLVVTRNADFDAENNNSIETAQELISSEAAGSRWVLGHIDPGTSGLFSTGNDGTSLITIDSRTGTGSVVGPFGTPGTFTAAFTPDGTLWTIVDGFNVNGAQLATVDPATGVAIRVGSPVWTGSPVFAMDADASGQLYAGGWDGTFFIVDTVTGQMTPIGFMGFFSAMDFAFDNDGVLWALDTGENLYSIDPITGAGTFRSRIVGLNGLAMGLMVDPSDNSLYVTTYTADSNLYRVDPSTGSTELIGPVGIVFPHGGDFEPIVAPEGDFYRISVDGNGTIEMETRTPAYKSGEFQNNLDPVLRLYDAAGNLVATNDNGGSDGRNAKLKYKVPKNSGGVYYVEVAASDAAEQTTQGEYILSVNGTTRTLDAFVVTDTNPADGSRVYTAPREFEVSFNDTVSVPTLQGADFRLNGKPASSVTSVDGDTVRFQNALAFQWTPDLGGNGHYYVLTSGPKGWLDAQAEAVALGGNLVTVNDQLEQNYLKRVFFSGPNEFFTYWTGLNDINQEGVFEWVSGEPVTYTNWNVPYEPNDFGPGEDGTQINWNPFLNNGAWNDLYLSWNLYGIIELTSLPA